MLYNVIKYYRDGRRTEDIVYSDGLLVQHPKDEGLIGSLVKRVQYKVENPFCPGLFIKDDKKYIIPMWIEVHPDTKQEDIYWIKPVIKEKPIVEKTKGSVGEYKTTYDPNKKTYKCTCMGFWRSKGNCKHVKELKNKNK